MTDPTPTATAREALARAMLAATGVPWERTEVSVRDAYLDEADAILAALPDGWTLAAAEAPGRVAYRDQVARREKAFETLEQRLSQLFAAPTPIDPVARCEGYDLVDRPDLAPNIVCALPAGHVGYHKPAPGARDE